MDAAKALVGEWEKEVRSAGVDADRASSHLQEMEKALREARAQAEDAVKQANLAQQELADARLGAAEEADTLRAQVRRVVSVIHLPHEHIRSRKEQPPHPSTISALSQRLCVVALPAL